MAKIAKPKEGNEKISEEVNILSGQLARALADYDNLRKRTESERQILIKTAGLGIIARLLPILDSLEGALKHLKDEGLAISIGEFKKVFNEEGLEEISPREGEEFSENLHEVVETIEGKEKGKIADLVLAGWKFKAGPVVRHARVVVYKGGKT